MTVTARRRPTLVIPTGVGTSATTEWMNLLFAGAAVEERALQRHVFGLCTAKLKAI
ncbi:MAG: hypothetical protein WBX38_15325 [Candidatus Sulfotelmatobacter sp.]